MLHSIVLLGSTLNGSLCNSSDSPALLSLGPVCGEYVVINHADRFDHVAATADITFPVS